MLDIAGQALTKTVKFYDNAAVVKNGTQSALHMDGSRDFFDLGRVTAIEKSQKTAFSVDFTRENADSGTEKLVWNHLKLGLSIVGDGLRVSAATANQGFKAFDVQNLGLTDTNLHRAIVMVDSASDHLQVILDDRVVLDVTNVDFQVPGGGGREAGWTLGNAWNEFYQGDVSDFRVGDRFEFLDDTYVPPAQSAFG